ncbi:MAG: hypothetical protein FWD17_12785 [Polyangiaceae bacterium]|nr:hypothetical protein [Polyangiaceae bacterium]
MAFQPAFVPQAASHTLSPQVVRTVTSWRDVDVSDNPWARARRRFRRRLLMTFVALIGGLVAVAKLHPQAVPPAVAQPVARYVVPVARWVGAVAGPAVSHAGSLLVVGVARVAHAVQTVHGASAAGAPAAPARSLPAPARPAEPPAVDTPAIGAGSAAPAGTPATPNPLAPPPVVDISNLPVARHGPPARVPVAVPPAPPAAAPAPRAAHPPPAVHAAVAPPKPTANDDDAPKAAAPPKPVPAPHPVANTAPPPAPGSLDDLIRKAVEAESKKKH